VDCVGGKIPLRAASGNAFRVCWGRMLIPNLLYVERYRN